MNIRRRDILIAAGCVTAAPPIKALAALPAGPPLWVATRGASKVYIFGFADAKDRSWLTPTLERAFRESRQIWFETPHPNPVADDLPSQPKQSRLMTSSRRWRGRATNKSSLNFRPTVTYALISLVCRIRWLMSISSCCWTISMMRSQGAYRIASAGSLAVLHRGRSIGCVRRIQRSTNTSMCDGTQHGVCASIVFFHSVERA